MRATPALVSQTPDDVASCTRCARPLNGSAYEVRGPDGLARRCLRCALRHRPIVVRSVVISFIVGTALTAINQGNVLIGGNYTAALLWKIPLTYAVPYAVSTTVAMMGARTPSRTAS